MFNSDPRVQLRVYDFLILRKNSEIRCEVHCEVPALLPNFGMKLTTSQRTWEPLAEK